MTKTARQDYDVKACAPDDLDEAEYARCIDIIKSGDAVNVHSAQKELPLALVLVVARMKNQIVGVGVIKRIRPYYAFDIARKSEVPFPSNMPELGYVAVDSSHQGNGLSRRIVAELLSKHAGPLFATTYTDRMKNTLRKAGFVPKGREWKGQKAQLSLWTRE